MSGILFLKSRNLSKLREFYTKRLACEVWLDQADCTIFRHGNFLFGFCDREAVETGAMLTFFYTTREEVDAMYRALKSIAVSPPTDNDRYNIYQFFAHDPEGRMIEFQHFNDAVSNYLSGDQLLLSRRSVRQFSPDDIPEDTLQAVIELSRWAPSSHNCQPYYFRIIRDRETINRLSKVRDRSSSPIARAPLAVAICSDPSVSSRHIQDGCIAAYHLLLAAWFHGLGTCWIADLDREEVKDILGVPHEHYVATVTPLGYPQDRFTPARERKPAQEFLR